jgi:hypothetical protein
MTLVQIIASTTSIEVGDWTNRDELASALSCLIANASNTNLLQAHFPFLNIAG